MRLLTTAVSFLAFSLIPSTGVVAQSQHPSVKTLGTLVNQLSNVIQDVKRFDGSPVAAQNLVQHIEDSLKTLDFAVNEIQQSGKINLRTALTFGPVGGKLGEATQALKTSLSSKRSYIQQAQISDKLWYLFDHAYSDASSFMTVLRDKSPQGTNAIFKILHNELVSTIGDIRELFRPTDFVVVIDGRPQNVPQGRPQDMPQGRPQNFPQGGPPNFPQGGPQNFPQGGPPNFPQGGPQGPPQGRPQNIPQGWGQDYQQGRPQNMPQGRPPGWK